MRLFPQENPLCQRMSCDHPLKGARREGHFDMGMGPCKAPGCQCTSFQYTDPSLLLDMRIPRSSVVTAFSQSRMPSSSMPSSMPPSAMPPSANGMQGMPERRDSGISQGA